MSIIKASIKFDLQGIVGSKIYKIVNISDVQPFKPHSENQ
jgi:hypothetical protein